MDLGCTYFSRSHHHTTTDSIERVRADTSASSNNPAESERRQKVTLKRTNEEDRLDRIVHSKVETAVHDDTSDGGAETTIETTNAISGEGLLVDIDETVELTVTTSLGVLRIVGKTRTGVVKGVDKEKGGCTGSLLVC